MRKRVTYRPSKAEGAFGTVVGGIFVLIGVFIAIPSFGPFGILWTLMAVGITGLNAYRAFGKGYAGPEIHIEEEETRAEAKPEAGLDAKHRLEQLETLRDAGLIDEGEYREKRQEILRDL